MAERKRNEATDSNESYPSERPTVPQGRRPVRDTPEETARRRERAIELRQKNRRRAMRVR